MDRRCTPENGLSYSNLFNLEPLMSYRLPQQEDDFDAYGNSSQDESRGEGAVLDNGNGYVDRSTGVNMKGRKRRASEPDSGLAYSSSNDEDAGSYGAHISEEQYRLMLGEHVQKYRRLRFKEPSGPASNRMVTPTQKHGHSMKIRKLVDEPFVLKEELTTPNSENSPEQNGLKFGSKYSSNGIFFSSLESSYLDLGEGITYKIPPTYDKLVVSLKLPSYSDIRVEDHFLKGTLDLQSLASMVGSDKGFKTSIKGGMGDPVLQYESLQARLKALSSNSPQKFSLQVCDEAMDPFGIPEGAAGRIRRLILSESGALQVYYVKVLEKGDTYEIIERSLPKKHLAKKDQMMIEREEIDKIGKVWANIARREIPKHHRIFNSIHRKHLLDAKRFSETCQREVKLKVSRSLRVMKGSSIRTRKLARDVLLFWKRVEKEQAEQRKKEEKEAAEALKREEELREAKRQQQRLNFLLSQTELYSHFMQNKPAPQSSESLAGEVGDLRASDAVLISPEAENEEDLEELELKREALRAAQHAVSQQKKITSAFDSECLKLRQSAEPEAVNADSVMGSSDIDLLHPSTMPVTSSVQTPAMFRGTLKEYQIKGLQWLVNCYEQGLNGILADEMGLGKTIQAMAFLAHLAEEKNIWGPFLVVAPSSVLNNWTDEVSRFCPSLKTLPYWGGLQERTVLRKNINPKRLYRREAGFHILITSYQLLVLDEKYLRRVKWQYMVLDEAQAIKSSSSIRWKTLLSFNCRNRLLLTGTPIQNNMAELWALLHFIMPTLFDSHEQFNEWFSKGIENHAEHGGTLNEHQLNRLHAVLKPFMLRRVKKDVISEMTGKTEVTVHCPLSSRQQAFYQAIKNKISLSELIEGRSGRLHDKKLQNLMNIVIQLRKVCNHPELFERNEGSTYVYFSEISNPLQPPPFGELDIIHYPGGWNPILYMIPKLVYQEIIQGVEVSSCHGVSPKFFERHFSVFFPENIYRSALHHDRSLGVFDGYGESFGFSRLMDLSPIEVSFLMKGSIFERMLFSVMTWDRMFIDEIVDMFVELEGEDLQHENLDSQKVRAVSRMLLIPSKSDSSLLRRKLATGPGDAPYEALTISFQDRLIANTRLLHSIYAFIPRVQAPPICTLCSDRSFAYRMTEELHNPWVKRLLVGFARTSEFNGPSIPNGPHPLIRERDSELPVSQPILEDIYKIFGSSPPMRNFDPSKMLTESGKLQVLDTLLKRLRAENHRVLLFAQMTKMLDILEDYMNYRKYRYLRLDGSSTIVDRRDMVRDFQHRSDIFVFLLSTRAGGLGINLTAADTVIFFESDWNPTLDLQAMDRAHRLGQTKEVTVYRLICKETVEEKILQRASQKNTVQQLVMTGGHVQDDSLDPSDFLSLLLDDAQMEQKLREIPLQQARERQKKKGSKRLRVDAEGNATLEEFRVGELDGGSGQDPILDSQDGSTNKKRKSNSNKQPASNLRNQPDADENGKTGLDDDATLSIRPKRAKKKSINENLEPAVSIAADPVTGEITDNTQTPYDSGSAGYEARFDMGTSDAPTPV